MTPKQKRMLDFIAEYTNKNMYAPSQQEIANHFGFKSLGTVQNYLVRLQREGFLQRTWNARRGVKVQTPHSHSQTPNGTVPLPLSGRVAAGKPIEAVEQQETVDVPASMLGRGKHFVLQVVGDSMIGDGILDGDYAIVRKQPTANWGQTVVALVENEATIKRFYKKGKKVELRAANPAYESIWVESMVDFKIEGVLVGVIRQL